MISFDVSLSREGQEFQFQAVLEGRITAVIGRSGSGKTTLARMLAGLVTPSHGFIEFNGRCVFDAGKGVSLAPERRGVGYVFQTHRVFPHLSVRQNLAFAPRFCGRTSVVTVETMAEYLHLTQLLDRPASALSGGEAQRCSLGRAILAAESLLIMDEPFANLDPALTEEMMGYLETLPEILNVPILFITHSPAQAKRLAPETLLIHQGRTAFYGSTDEALAQPQYFGETP